MSYNSWNQTLMTAQVAGTALSNTTTATSILPPHARFTFPANYLQIGSELRITAGGVISTAASAPGTLTLDVQTGGAVVLFNGGASGTLAVSASNLTWRLDIKMVVRAVGTTGTTLGIGEFKTAALSATTPIQFLPASSPVVGSSFDTTSSFVLDLFAAWSVASASNSIQLLEYELALLN